MDDIRPDSGNERIYKRLELLLNEAEDIYIDTVDVICLEDEKRASGGNSQKETNKK